MHVSTFELRHCRKIVSILNIIQSPFTLYLPIIFPHNNTRTSKQFYRDYNFIFIRIFAVSLYIVFLRFHRFSDETRNPIRIRVPGVSSPWCINVHPLMFPVFCIEDFNVYEHLFFIGMFASAKKYSANEELDNGKTIFAFFEYAQTRKN